ncbi:MAG: hypothetical protein JG781_215 [Peptococcaceae bacterium]|nr:hypothetical protein [Peptococcaceae bacterium]
MKDFKQGLWYFLYIVLLGVILNFGYNIEHEIRVLALTRANTWGLHFYELIYPIVIGIYFATPNFINEINNPGKWDVNWTRLISAGIPTLYIASTNILYLSVIGKYLPLPMNYDRMFYSLFGIVFGYILLTSVRKSKS